MSALLAGRCIVVTGAAQEGSIGDAIARLCAQEGARVAILSRDAQAAARAASRVHGSGHACELTSDADVARAAREIAGVHGEVHGVVHNAGVPVSRWDRPFSEVPMADFRLAFEVDVLGAARLTRALLPSLAPREASLVFTSSTAAIGGYAALHEFAPAKAGVLGLMRSLAAEYGARGIRSNAVAYGNIRSAATWAALDDARRAALAEENPLARWGTPEEAAGASVFLLSRLAAFVNGQTLVVDGGTLMR